MKCSRQSLARSVTFLVLLLSCHCHHAVQWTERLRGRAPLLHCYIKVVHFMAHDIRFKGSQQIVFGRPPVQRFHRLEGCMRRRCPTGITALFCVRSL